MEHIRYTKDDLLVAFKVLDHAHIKGMTNMTAGVHYLVTEHGWDALKAARALGFWMKTTSEDKSLEDRVQAALKLVADEQP